MEAIIDRAALVAAVDVPVLQGLQFQGDLAVRPRPAGQAKGAPVPAKGVVVIGGGADGHSHALVPGMGSHVGAVRFDARPEGLVLGVVHVDSGATALLVHERHGYNAIGPGSYELRRQRVREANRAGAHQAVDTFVLD